MTIEQGVDTDKMAEFVEFAGQNPEQVQFQLSAQSTYEGVCAHSLAKVKAYQLGDQTIERDTREYTISFGAWREVMDKAGWLEATDRLEPIEAALASLASCINVGISVNAVADGVSIDKLQTNVRADFNPGVLFSLQDVGESDTVFDNVHAHIEVVADVDPERIAEWARRAPVFALVDRGQNVALDVDMRR